MRSVRSTRARYDYFHDKFNTSPEKGGQRLATVLGDSEGEEGGETVLRERSPKPDYAAPPLSRRVLVGLRQARRREGPRKGDALLFFSLTDNMNEDPLAGLLRTTARSAGEKWSATKWMHIGEFDRRAQRAQINTLVART